MADLKHIVDTTLASIDDENSSNLEVDVERMKAALNSERFQVPENASRESIREFIISVGTKNIH